MDSFSKQAMLAQNETGKKMDDMKAYAYAHKLTQETAQKDPYYQKLVQSYRQAKDAEDTLRARQTRIGLQIDDIKSSLDPERVTTFRGMSGADFKSSYKNFITDVQGHAVPGYTGDCGINETCSILNQQMGWKLTEADGIRDYEQKGLCSSKGGTTAVQRATFLTEKGLSFRRVEGSYDTGVELSLDDIAANFNRGESAGLMLKSEDLSQAGLASRKFDFRKKFKDNLARYDANHATTVAGFSYNKQGKVTGVWINDTGNWAGSNRVFISAQKFYQMQRNTRGFSVEFSKKR